MDTEVKLTASQMRKMQHALGMDNKQPKRGKYEAYRNYYNTSSEDSELEDLIKVGYATKRTGSGTFPGIWYFVSKAGITYLEEIMNIKITESE